MKINTKSAIAFDFDGVIHKYRLGWKDGSIYDEPNSKIISIMKMLVVDYHIPVFILSTRDPEQIVKWWNKLLIGEDLPAKVISSDVKFFKSTEYIGVTDRKLPAQIYVDDRAYRYSINDETYDTFSEIIRLCYEV